MQDISLHILDIAENAIRADAGTIHIEITEDEKKDRMMIRITDDGTGMDSETVQKVLDPFFTTKNGKRVGLGLSLLQQAAEQTGGELVVDSREGEGTCITAVFIRSHPDMKPLENVIETMAALIAGYPARRFIYDYKNGDDSFHYDTSQ